ncbi:uncharacterized protein LOC133320192 [Danaus plexippus]|uniref:uncharacterized protein LOC133320192 n=1 Tax=Danaus plexippus TaxID=13037 RepID=UPI002AB1BD3A|nr:uncharacterized protein LOC133320192 [Danaus plexippus]
MVASCRIAILAIWLTILKVQLIYSDDRYNLTVHPFVGYFQGFKLGQNLVLQLPSFFVSPVAFVPSAYHYQDTSKVIFDGTYEKHDSNVININTKTINSNFLKVNNLDVEDFSTNKLRLPEGDSEDLFTQSLVNDSTIVESKENKHILNEKSTTVEPNSEVEITAENNMTTKETGPYTSSLYNNQYLKNLTITRQEIDNNFTLPSTENHWQNFSLPSDNNSTNHDSERINGSTTAEIAISPPKQSSVITNFYPYPNAVSHSAVDKLSITTNSYLDEGSNLPLSYDDRWQSFTSLTKLYPNFGFRPLSGLYYDGFLHKSLNKKNGFIPYYKVNNN